MNMICDFLAAIACCPWRLVTPYPENSSMSFSDIQINRTMHCLKDKAGDVVVGRALQCWRLTAVDRGRGESKGGDTARHAPSNAQIGDNVQVGNERMSRKARSCAGGPCWLGPPAVQPYHATQQDNKLAVNNRISTGAPQLATNHASACAGRRHGRGQTCQLPQAIVAVAISSARTELCAAIYTNAAQAPRAVQQGT